MGVNTSVSACCSLAAQPCSCRLTVHGLLFFFRRALFYCKACHDDITDPKRIKKCGCKKCKCLHINIVSGLFDFINISSQTKENQSVSISLAVSCCIYMTYIAMCPNYLVPALIIHFLKPCNLCIKKGHWIPFCSQNKQGPSKFPL